MFPMMPASPKTEPIIPTSVKDNLVSRKAA